MCGARDDDDEEIGGQWWHTNWATCECPFCALFRSEMRDSIAQMEREVFRMLYGNEKKE